MKKIINVSLVPNPGYFLYVNPEDGHEIKHGHWHGLLVRVKEYRRINNYPIGLNINEEIEQNVCAHAKEGTCAEFTPPTAAEMAVSLTKALFKAARTGFKVVDNAEYQRRLDICKACNFFSGTHSLLKVHCTSCGCRGLKVSLASSNCPAHPPRW